MQALHCLLVCSRCIAVVWMIRAGKYTDHQTGSMSSLALLEKRTVSIFWVLHSLPLLSEIHFVDFCYCVMGFTCTKVIGYILQPHSQNWSTQAHLEAPLHVLMDWASNVRNQLNYVWKLKQLTLMILWLMSSAISPGLFILGSSCLTRASFFPVVMKPFVPLSCCAKNQYGDYVDKQKCQHATDRPPGQMSEKYNEALHYRVGLQHALKM